MYRLDIHNLFNHVHLPNLPENINGEEIEAITSELEKRLDESIRMFRASLPKLGIDNDYQEGRRGAARYFTSATKLQTGEFPAGYSQSDYEAEMQSGLREALFNLASLQMYYDVGGEGEYRKNWQKVYGDICKKGPDLMKSVIQAALPHRSV